MRDGTFWERRGTAIRYARMRNNRPRHLTHGRPINIKTLEQIFKKHLYHVISGVHFTVAQQGYYAGDVWALDSPRCISVSTITGSRVYIE